MLVKYLIRTRALLSSSPYFKQIQELYVNKKYEEILELQSLQSLSRNDIKQKYYSLIKKYHTDNCQNDAEKAQEYEEITKIIISSYHALDKKLAGTKHAPGEENFVEDTICLELFGKKYNEVKYWMYEKGNEKSKKQFFDRLYQVTGASSTSTNKYPNEDFSQVNNNQKTYTTHSRSSKTEQSSSSSTLGLAAVGIFGVIGLFWYSSIKSQSSKPQTQNSRETKLLKQEDVDRITEKSEKIRLAKAEAMIKTIVRDHPPSLKYPDEEPSLMTQLTELSVAPDIHLYEVEPECFKDDHKEQIIQNGLSKDGLFELARIKPNTTLTLSLEAERAMQNTYVKVKDVIKEIKKTGTFKPPQFFIKYHGFIMFELREKPLSLANYKDTDYISIFDLFFDYYSPIFMKKDRFAQYLVEKDNPELFGWVYLNNKKFDPVYLNGNEKAVYFLPIKKGEMEEYYEKLWFRYYFYFQDKWKGAVKA